MVHNNQLPVQTNHAGNVVSEHDVKCFGRRETLSELELL
jgi:hypothetical protein